MVAIILCSVVPRYVHHNEMSSFFSSILFTDIYFFGLSDLDVFVFQNKNNAADPATIPEGTLVTHKLIDGTGVSFPAMNIMALQSHPEASPSLMILIWVSNLLKR